MEGLENKVIVVTGGNGLIGRVIREYLGKHKAKVISVDIEQDKVDRYNRVANITSEEEIQQLIADVVSDFGRIDGWVNNAYPRTNDWGNKVEDINMDSWRKNVDMHLNGYFLCCRLVLSQMQKQQSGSVIIMSSIYGMVGPDFSVYEGTSMTMPAAYAAIKGGLVNLTRYLASYYGPFNVRINSISPGGIFDHQPDSFIQRYEGKVPLRRMGTPQDIAPGVGFLLSDQATYITGHNLVIDGGWTAI